MSLTFEQWMVRVDRILESICGCSFDELEDWDWEDNFQNGATPKVAAQDALDYMGFYDMMEAWS